MTIEQLEMIAKQEPVVTTSGATTAMKGYSECKFCGQAGLFSIYHGREWDHSADCPWVVARKQLEIARKALKEK